MSQKVKIVTWSYIGVLSWNESNGLHEALKFKEQGLEKLKILVSWITIEPIYPGYSAKATMAIGTWIVLTIAEIAEVYS